MWILMQRPNIVLYCFFYWNSKFGLELNKFPYYKEKSVRHIHKWLAISIERWVLEYKDLQYLTIFSREHLIGQK